MIKVRVPATSANMGPGFDSLGVALQLYNYVTVEEIDSGIEIEILDSSKKFLPQNEKNLVYRAMKEVFEKAKYSPSGIKLTLESFIPVTRGLGSSSAGIVGGLYAANLLSGKPFSKEELLRMAVMLEGHADNVTPAMMGGFTVSVLQHGKHHFVSHKLKDDLRFAAIIPDFPLATKKARAILPRFVSHRDAVYNTGHSSLLAASLISGDYSNIRVAVGDRLHQYYRKNLIPSMDELFNICYRNGALGVYLSGAGPTLIAIINAENKEFFPNVSRILAQKMQNWHLDILKTDNLGVTEI
jgi:homoserine kinase